MSTLKKIVFLIALFTVFISFFCKKNEGNIIYHDFFDSNLPLVIIDTNGKEILDESKLPVTIKIINNINRSKRNSVDDVPEYMGRAGIELRGYSSLEYPKKQYSLEIRDAYGYDFDVSLLGMPPESDWILSAPYSDKTLIRNRLAYKLAFQTGMYTPRTRFVELLRRAGDKSGKKYRYEGIYLLVEKIKRNRFRVDIKKMKKTYSREPQISGGYLLEIDRLDSSKFNFKTSMGMKVNCRYPLKRRITDAQMEWIERYLNKFEKALKSEYFLHPEKGYRKYVDVQSWIDFILLRELFRDVDTYKLSTFFYKKRNDKIYMGPLWDFNFGMGNCNYEKYKNSIYPEGWEMTPADKWWWQVLKDDEFRKSLIMRWKKMRKTVLSHSNIISLIDNDVELLKEALERNFQRWPVIGIYVKPNPTPIPASYEEEITRLKKWISTRLIWIDNNIQTIGR